MAAGPGVTIDIRRKRHPGAAGPLFEGLKLEVAAGSVVALLGPSGVGKSSLLRLVAGIDRDFDGRIAVDGVPAAEAPPPGFVFQDARLLPWLSARDNVLAVAPGEDADGWLGRVGLGDSSEAYPHQLSGGMQRRVALARALAVNRKLLLLDEPFVSLDRPLAAELQRLFAEAAAAEKSTVILVSHLPEDAARLADRVVVLQGRPARAAADIALEPPRESRDAHVVLRLTERLAALAEEVGR